jgi:hypothetical protein
MTWSAQSLQFVLFTAPKPGQPDALQPWLKLFNSSPQNYQQAPAGAPQVQSNASAMIGNFNVMVGAMPGRFDVILTSSDAPSNTPPLIGDVQAALRTLVAYAHQFLAFQPAQRLAIVANLIEEAADQDAAVKRFKELAGGINVPNGGTDLALQVNVPKIDAAIGHQINRLCRWQTQLLQMVTLHLDASTGQGSPLVQTSHAMGVMIDVNTAPAVVDFEQNKATNIVNALAAEVEQIMSGGYDYVAA